MQRPRHSKFQLAFRDFLSCCYLLHCMKLVLTPSTEGLANSRPAVRDPFVFHCARYQAALPVREIKPHRSEGEKAREARPGRTLRSGDRKSTGYRRAIGCNGGGAETTRRLRRQSTTRKAYRRVESVLGGYGKCRRSAIPGNNRESRRTHCNLKIWSWVDDVLCAGDGAAGATTGYGDRFDRHRGTYRNWTGVRSG